MFGAAVAGAVVVVVAEVEWAGDGVAAAPAGEGVAGVLCGLDGGAELGVVGAVAALGGGAACAVVGAFVGGAAAGACAVGDDGGAVLADGRHQSGLCAWWMVSRAISIIPRRVR